MREGYNNFLKDEKIIIIIKRNAKKFCILGKDHDSGSHFPKDRISSSLFQAHLFTLDGTHDLSACFILAETFNLILPTSLCICCLQGSKVHSVCLGWLVIIIFTIHLLL